MDDTGFLHDVCSDINLLQDNLRSRYTYGFPILKELVQNADDAGASVIHLGWTLPPTGVVHPLLRGPALFVVNNGEFKPQDALALYRVGLNAKASDRTAIGKFGLGLKSVFHLCEAVLFFSSASHQHADGILNPWAGRGDVALSFHRDWNTFTPEDRQLLRQHLNNLLTSQHWFALWIPLRRKAQLEGCAPIIEEFPGDDPTMPSWCSGRTSIIDLACLFPLLRRLANIYLWAPWRVGGGPTAKISLGKGAGRRIYDGKVKPTRAHFFEGSVSIHIAGDKPVDARYVAQEAWLDSLAAMKKEASWPRSFSINPETQKPDRVKEKADPHFAVSMMSRPEPEGGLRTARAVFLPLTRTQESLPCQAADHTDMLLHGYFFVDAGRGDLEETGGQGSQQDHRVGEVQLRSDWNSQLWRQGTLSLLLTTLKHFCTSLNKSPDYIRALTACLQNHKYVKDDIAHICRSHHWVYRLGEAGGCWELVPGELSLLELPQADENERLPFLAFPKLAAVAESVVLTFADWPRLALAAPPRYWPEDHLATLLVSPGRDLIDEPRRLDYVSRFLTQVLPSPGKRGGITGPLTAFVRDVCRLLPTRPTDELQRAVLRLLLEIPSASRRRLPLAPSPLGAAAWDLLARLPFETVLYPEAYEPKNAEGTASLSLADAAALLRAVACEDFARIRLTGAEHLRERLSVAVLRCCENRSQLIVDCKDLPLFRNRVDSRDAALLSLQDVVEARLAKTLFMTQAASCAGTLQRAVPDVRIVLLDREIHREWIDDLGPCDTAACVGVLARRPALSVRPADRQALLDALTQQPPADRRDYTETIRYLLHGQPEYFEDTGVLLVDGERQDSLWNKLCNAVLDELGEGWRRIPPELRPERARAELNLKAIGPEAANQLLQQVPIDRLARLTPALDLREYKQLLTELQQERSRPLLRLLKIHPDVEGRPHSFEEEYTYWQGELTIQDRTLSAQLVFLPLGHGDGVLAALQRWVAPDRVLDPAALLALLVRKEWLAHYWDVALHALAVVPSLSSEQQEALRQSEWLPSQDGQRRIAPSRVLFLPELTDEASRAVEGQDDTVGPRSLCEKIRGHAGFANLSRWCFPPPQEGLRTLGKLLGAVPTYRLGRSAAGESFPLEEFFQAFEGVDETFLPALVLLQRIRDRYSPVDARDNVLPGLLQADLTDERVLELLERLLEQHARNVTGRKAVLRMYCWYLRHLAAKPQLWERLRSLRLFNAANEVCQSAQLCWPSEGISKRCQLHPDVAGVLAPHRPPVRQVKKAAEGQADGRIDVGKFGKQARDSLERYFTAWENRVDRPVIGGFLAVLGGGVEIQTLALDRLGSNFNELETIRGALYPQSNVVLCDPTRILQQLLQVEVVPRQDKIDEKNLFGEPIKVDISPDLHHLFIDFPGEGPFPKSLNSNPMYTVRRMRLRTPDPVLYSRDQLATVLRASAERFMRIVYGIPPNPVGLDRLFGALQENDRRDVEIAQEMLVEHALNSALQNLGLNTQPPFYAILRAYEQATRKLLQQQRLSARNSPDDERACSQAKRHQAKELQKLLESDQEVQKKTLEAVRAKIRGHFGYVATAIPFELFQNADDAYVELQQHLLEVGQELPVEPCLVVFNEESRLVFLHAGRRVNQEREGTLKCESRGFHQDIEKMIRLTFSDKQLPDQGVEVTGKFGLGFKSVFLVADAPRVCSGRLSFEVVGGLYPRWWDKADKALATYLASSALPPDRTTTIDLALSNGEAGRSVLDDFHRLLPVLVAFARQIKRVTLHQAERTPEQFSWEETAIEAAAGCAIGRLPSNSRCRWSGKLALRLEAGAGSVLLLLDQDQFTAFDPDVPTVWVTAPTREYARVGFLINGTFELDPGRASLPHHAVEKNQREAEAMGVELGKRLVALFQASAGGQQGRMFSPPHFSAQADLFTFWESWWELCGRQLVTRLEQADGIVRDLLRALLWGNQECGATRLYASQPALPSGLSAGSYRTLCLATEIDVVVAGCLDTRPALLERVAAWASFRQFKAGRVVSDSSTWQPLHRLCPSLCRRPPRVVRLQDVAATELDRSQAATPDVAERLGRVIDRALLEGLQGTAEGESLVAWMFTVSFYAEDGRPHPVRELLLPTADDSEQRDEALRAAFAPLERVLSNDYGEEARAFFLLCRRRMEADVEQMVEWAVRAPNERERKGVVRYLLDGLFGLQLANRLGEKGAAGTWLGLLSLDWHDYPKDQQYEGYLHSPEWEYRREAVRARCEGVCEGCRQRPMEEVHHLRYTVFGHEPLEDLQGLCSACHAKLHAQKSETRKGRPPDPGVRYREWLEVDEFRFSPETLLHLLRLSDAPPTLVTPRPQPRAILREIHNWWLKARDSEVAYYNRLVYPDRKPPSLRLDDQRDPQNRKSWLTLFLLGLMHTMGRQRHEQHRSFLQLCERRKWLDIFADPAAGADRWMGIVDQFWMEQVEEANFLQWMKQFVCVRVFARYLEGYIDIFREVGRMDEDFALTALTRPRNSAALQGWGPDAPPVSRALGVGACFVVRELIRLRVVEDNPVAYPHCFVPVGSTRRLLGDLGCPGLLSEAVRPWERSRFIHRFLVKHLGEDARFGGDFDLPLFLVGRRRELQERFLQAPLRVEATDQDEMVFDE